MRKEMRRGALLLAAMVVGLVVGSGAALASHIINCTSDPCLGTDGEDIIQGTDGPDTIRALAGDDLVKGFGRNDVMYGGKGNDLMDGFAGKDTIYGGRGGDGSAEGVDFPRFPGDERNILNLEGGEDSDTVYGGPGPDVIDAARNDKPLQNALDPVDSSFGGDGNDHIWAVDGNVDIINCGPGQFDFADVDAEEDTDVTNCEFTTGY